MKTIIAWLKSLFLPKPEYPVSDCKDDQSAAEDYLDHLHDQW